MKKLRKTFVLLLATMMTLGFTVGVTACKNGDDKTSSNKKPSSSQKFSYSVTDDAGEEGDWTDNY